MFFSGLNNLNYKTISFMKTKFTSISALLLIALFANCENKNKSSQSTAETTQETKTTNVDSARVNGTACDITISGIHFTKSVNGADTLATADTNSKITFKTGAKKDYFSDPNGKLSNNTAPILLSKIDNKKPFTLISKVTPEFTKEGLYNAAVLYIYVHDNFWQKLCYEQDERGNHRIVSVRTIGTSDDNNHDKVTTPSIYMKISSDTETVANYYSYDKKNWHMVRLYENNYPDEIWVGISNQCPMDDGSFSVFEDLSLVQNSVSDFRMGN